MINAYLPSEGVAEHFNRFIAIETASRIVGTAGLEIRGLDALLRSVAVAPKAFFPRFGFERIGWGIVPAKVKESCEFLGACPSSAVAMRARLEGAA